MICLWVVNCWLDKASKPRKDSGKLCFMDQTFNGLIEKWIIRWTNSKSPSLPTVYSCNNNIPFFTLCIEYCTRRDHGGAEWTICSGEQAGSCCGWRKLASHHQHHQGDPPLQYIVFFLSCSKWARGSTLDMAESCSWCTHKHSLLFGPCVLSQLLWLPWALIKA